MNINLYILLPSSGIAFLLLTCYQAEPSSCHITYTLNGGRLGDNLITYAKAKWLSHKYNLPLLYKSFEYSDKLALHAIETPFEAQDLKTYTQITVEHEDQIKPDETQTLYTVSLYTTLYDWYDWESDRAFPKHLTSDFAAIMHQCIQPLQALPPLKLPENMATLAVHVRKGGGFDRALLSEQENPTMPTDIYHYVDVDFPLKFPPDQYYIDHINYISELIDNKPLYVHIFTDDANPENLVEKYRNALNKTNITFGTRKYDNTHDSHVLEDLFAMQQFDYLIRSTSSYAKTAHLIGNFKTAIWPEHASWKNQLLIDKVRIDHKQEESNSCECCFTPQVTQLLDVIVLCTATTQQNTIRQTIDSLHKNIGNIGHIVTVGPRSLTAHARWFNTQKYPFTREDIAHYFTAYNPTPDLIENLYYQLLKLYAPAIIPNISDNVLIIDAGIFFLKPINLDNVSHGIFYTLKPQPDHVYMLLNQALLIGFKKAYPYAFDSRYIVMNRNVINEMFDCISSVHNCEPWQAICSALNPQYLDKGISVGDLYVDFYILKGYSGNKRFLMSKDFIYPSATSHQLKKRNYP